MAKPVPQPPAKRTSKRDQFRAQRKSQERRTRIIWISIATIAALAIAAILIIPNLPVDPGNIQTPDARVRTQVDRLKVGDPNAKVKVVEYSDFNCVHCKDFWAQGEDQLLTQYIETGKVYFEYIPMSFISPSSVTAAQAAYCAADQNKFWEYHDYVFANYGADFSSSMLKGLATKAGLNMNDFNTCFNANKYQLQVTKDMQGAQNAGINSTPTFLVNGVTADIQTLFTTIDKALAGN